MTWHDILTSMGINPAVVAAGGFGGALRALSRNKIKFREVVLSPLCGAMAAAYLTLPTVHYVKATGWPVPNDDAQVVLAMAFLIGTCGMWVADMVFAAVVRWFRPKED